MFSLRFLIIGLPLTLFVFITLYSLVLILPRPELIQTSPQQLADSLNQYRLKQNLPSFHVLLTACEQATTQKGVLLTITQKAFTRQIVERLLSDSTAKTLIADSAYSNLCIEAKNDLLTIFISQKQTTPLPTAKTTASPKKSINTTKPGASFSETALWEALLAYRNTHHAGDILIDDKFCQYARKRVADHQALLVKNLSAQEYPNPDKYPLDAHEGFKADASSGLAFEMTEVNQLAENLAYWPLATSPTQVIEWGWDSSTEGHREAQLSTDWTKGCISSDNGFFVAIFGR